VSDGRQEKVRDVLLRRLYDAFFAGQEDVAVGTIREQHGWDERTFWRVLEDMVAEGLVSPPDSGPRCEIKPSGVLDAESRKIVPPRLAATNNCVRALILAKYAETYEAKGREGDRAHGEVLAAVTGETDADAVVVAANHEFLWDAGLLEAGSLGYFMISQGGLAAVREWRRRSDLGERFDALHESLSPQARGRQFQSLFNQLASDAGWRVDESVLGPGEEIDLVLHRQDAFCLVECRWKNGPVSAMEIRDFEGKLRKRSGVQGVFVSMSGYTADAVTEVVAVAGDTPIVLMGPGEVADLFNGRLTLNELLVEKKRSLVLRRKAAWR
jgi:hypothetical protein